MSQLDHTSKRIIIIGGGIAGLSIAVRLSQAGLPVTVLETSTLGFGASTRNQGWLHSGAWFAISQPELAKKCYQSLLKTLKYCPDCIEPHHTGTAYLITQPETLVTEWTSAWNECGIPFEILEHDDLKKALPGIAEQEIQHAFLLSDRSIRVDLLIQQLAATAENGGVEIRTETHVDKLLRKDDNITGVLLSSGEELTAQLVILAGGGAGMRLDPDSFPERIGEQHESKLVPLKTHLVAVSPDVGHLPLCLVDEGGFCHMPHAPQSVFGSNHWLTVASGVDNELVPQEIDQIWKNINRFFPSVDREKETVREWAGTTIQAMQAHQIEPGKAPLPTVIDHCQESPVINHLVSIYPGRATLWADVAETAFQTVMEKLEYHPRTCTCPPWEG
ncbi:hypothetical protein MNBD_PLANCTO02-1656 [hydrothermal vent metagenome]|uniref:FAD dependent oxidoreductase domain-containing protein n=1 Tax=hydrothermal vent metagenome TaxID=652676 RepID=A0A3B1E0K9_9ZZZZ